MQCCLMLVVIVNQSGQVNAAAGTAAGDEPASRHLSRLNSVGAAGGHGLQSTPVVSRLTPGDSAPAAHDYTTRTHGEGPTEMHVNTRLATEHVAANCTLFFQVITFFLCNKASQLYLQSELIA